MKILWITNALLPEAIIQFIGQNEIKGTGGWLLALSKALIKSQQVELFVACVTPLVKEFKEVRGKHISYFAIPYEGSSKYNKKYEDFFRSIYERVKPDVVHIHGTEFPHSLAALHACGTTSTVVSVQGLASVISRYYLAGLSQRDIWLNPTIHDILRLSLNQQKREMEKRGRYEEQLIQEGAYVIGRTSWDRSHIWAINPEITYFHCDEILRDEFYGNQKWEYDKCLKHCIFLSQGSSPLKGLHIVLEALPIIMRIYPDVTLRVAGLDITYSNSGIKGKLKISAYGSIVKKIIKKYRMQTNVKFLGALNADEMRQEYLKANVFVCPSSIENSPNSLGEAQVLGVPCVASYVGGVPDFMKNNEKYMYRFDDIEMMANKICDIFEKRERVDTDTMRICALRRHNGEYIANNMLSIYKKICCN